MTLQQWAEKGLSFDTYVNNMTVNQYELLHIYNNFLIPNELLPVLEDRQNDGWRVIALTADWCGDALLCVPVMKRICEVANIEMSLLIRDENLELMDQYLTNETARAIPIFIFIDAAGNEKAVWGPRAPKIQELVTSMRATLPGKDDPQFEEKQKEMYAGFRETLASDTSIWEHVMENMIEKIAK
ncbi:thioredoxin family protein [Bacillus sp. DX1.1]|uniref:thioredoxin family protein n=1 Tax=unclassified Bacillus (in: firmicutes) TaxID=185979 RepID=UPI002570A0E3|nr:MULTISPECIES: thioredoxin family protein [unclassified Bacillus (in: firmicutes)]MDM5154011.1 thioredoxin family protein [Bacillus sp. DX1.1]WJE82940.1 thioredoxin family protein [Bacillus sp. DX3.1]